MVAGILFCFLGAVCFGLMGALAKAAERKNCNASALVVAMFAGASVATLLRTVTSSGGFDLPARAILVAAACGICASAAALAFQVSIGLGNVTVPWLMMNLSTGVPALVSIWAYRESVSPLKVAAFGLAIAALLLLFRGYQIEDKRAKAAKAEEGSHVVRADAAHPSD